MNQKQITCCYFPTTILFVDDKLSFLKSLMLSLDKKLAYQLFNNPTQTLDFLHNNYKPGTFTDNWLSTLKNSDENNKTTHSLIDIDVFSIHKEIYNPDRFQEIAVVVVDYAMPDMDGLEFCQHLKDSQIKKLMLTGQASPDQAVEAFNSGVIQKFLSKDGLYSGQLNTNISELQRQYFHDLSSPIMSNLSREPGYYLNDPALITLFNKICKKHRIIEYYLVDSAGSFLMLDFEGKPSWLVIKTDQDVENHYNRAAACKNTSKIKSALQKREKIPFFFTEADKKIEPKDWKKYLHSANILIGRNKYHYAYIEGPSGYDIKTDKIASYKDHLAKL